jgi:hypothetical protein
MADLGQAAVKTGATVHGLNRDGHDGARTDAGDAIANILHWLFAISPEESLDARETFALGALETARRHFTAELRGEL